MGFINRLRGTGLPSAEKVTQYQHLPALVEQLNSTHSAALQTSLDQHGELHRAWTVIQESSHPDAIEASNDNLCEARRQMVADLISAVTTGQLAEIESAA